MLVYQTVSQVGESSTSETSGPSKSPPAKQHWTRVHVPKGWRWSGHAKNLVTLLWTDLKTMPQRSYKGFKSHRHFLGRHWSPSWIPNLERSENSRISTAEDDCAWILPTSAWAKGGLIGPLAKSLATSRTRHFGVGTQFSPWPTYISYLSIQLHESNSICHFRRPNACGDSLKVCVLLFS